MAKDKRTTSTSDVDSPSTVVYHRGMTTTYSIYKRAGRGNYICSFINPITGRRTNRSTGTGIKAEAYAKAQDIVRHAFDPPELEPDAPVLPLAPLVSKYSEYQRTHRGAKDASVTRSATVINSLLEWTGFDQVEQLKDHIRINEFFTYLLSKHSRNTVHQRMSHIKAWLRWLQDSDRLDVDVVKRLQAINVREKDMQERGPYTKDELDSLFNYLDDGGQYIYGMDAADRSMIFKLAAYTGLRRSEIFSLVVKDFQPGEQPSINVRANTTKNAKAAKQPVPKAILDQLVQWCDGLDPDEPMFKPTHRWKISDALNADLEQLNIPKQDSQGRNRDFHAFRVTYITRLIERKVDIKTVQQLARHANPLLTLKAYAKVQQDGLSSAADLLD
jgi:integrase